jgi:hypothetical protein
MGAVLEETGWLTLHLTYLPFPIYLNPHHFYPCWCGKLAVAAAGASDERECTMTRES